MNTLTIPAFSAEAAEAAQRRLDNLAKVPRSLGRIEELAVDVYKRQILPSMLKPPGCPPAISIRG